jgi:hypothetical protein
MLNKRQCKYATGEGRSPATVCKQHTFADVDDVLPELDGVFATETEEKPETFSEMSVDGWNATALPVEDLKELPDEEQEEAFDTDEESDDEIESADAEI